ncbi:hypothetical protein [Arthrobacter woluwensis]|uniref:hypothetical protein n=1 Tax=Arthrobacter woluwensis TaxID=156980 RepID=UPI0027D9194F|nr:hypothetical protein [Arthrobacter woluwensis]
MEKPLQPRGVRVVMVMAVAVAVIVGVAVRSVAMRMSGVVSVRVLVRRHASP